jgi:hypothetical protein
VVGFLARQAGRGVTPPCVTARAAGRSSSPLRTGSASSPRLTGWEAGIRSRWQPRREVPASMPYVSSGRRRR